MASFEDPFRRPATQHPFGIRTDFVPGILQGFPTTTTTAVATVAATAFVKLGVVVRGKEGWVGRHASPRTFRHPQICRTGGVDAAADVRLPGLRRLFDFTNSFLRRHD